MKLLSDFNYLFENFDLKYIYMYIFSVIYEIISLLGTKTNLFLHFVASWDMLIFFYKAGYTSLNEIEKWIIFENKEINYKTKIIQIGCMLCFELMKQQQKLTTIQLNFIWLLLQIFSLLLPVVA